MKHPLENTLLALSIALILTSWVSVNADTSKTTTSQVNYGYYYSLDYLKGYYRFLPSPAPEGLHYHIRMTATANIDDTPEKETLVLIVVETKPRTFSGNLPDFGNQSHAFLLIANTKGSKIEKKAFFKLFDTGTHPLEVPAAEGIELHSPPSGNLKLPTDVSLRLADVTDDGTLDVWVKSAHGVALISFENGAFKEVFSRYPVSREKLTKTADVEYYNYDVRHEPAGKKYHRFLATPPPEGASYGTRMKAVANIDDTPEKETIVLMVVNSKKEWRAWSQAFLLITEPETERDGFPKTKALFTLFGARTHDLNVPTKTIEVQSGPFVFRKPWSREDWSFPWVSFKLVDLTGDGILDIWAEHYQGVAVISFQDGEFKEVCSAYSSTGREDPIEYIDLDNDGIYEIKIPDSIFMIDIPGVRYVQWMSLYEWDGTAYVLNNERFYAENDEFLIRLLRQYNAALIRYGRFEPYSFYVGLVYSYRGNVPMAHKYLQWVAEHAENDRYIHAAEDLLKKLTPH